MAAQTDRVAAPSESELIDLLQDAMTSIAAGEVRAAVVAVDRGQGPEYEFFCRSRDDVARLVSMSNISNLSITMAAAADDF